MDIPTTSIGIPGTGPGGYYINPDEVICSYKEKCTDEGDKCKTCKNNTGRRSHYIPDINPSPFIQPSPYKWIPWYEYPRPRTPRPHLWCQDARY